MHATFESMRTTVEISDEHRAKLLELAARRGKKGFSEIVAEALVAYLRATRQDDARRGEALRMRGSLGNKEADRLRERTTELRRSWR